MSEIVSLGSFDAVATDPHSYRRYAPNLFNYRSAHDDLRTFILRVLCEDSVDCPEEGVWLIRNCLIVDGKHVLLESGKFVETSIVDRPLEDIKLLLRQSTSSTRAVNLRDQAQNDDPIVVFMKSGAANYGHVLIEMLPRLLNAKRIGLSRFNIILPQEALWAKSLIDFACSALDIQLKYIEVDTSSAHADEVVLLSPVSKHNRRKSQTVVDMTALLLEGVDAPKKARKLAVWRKPDEKRSIVGDAYLLSALRDASYDVVYPGEMSFVEQMQAFREATHIVAPLGAGLTNLVFAGPHCDVFMIDPGTYDFFFWDLSCLREQHFSWYFNKEIDFFKVDSLTRQVDLDANAVISALKLSHFI
ncbi:glycosyltransferase 61 family protein [Mesorhizobium sp. M0047]|uniref:glycosyltransferase family 61 protein n=1 Tax=Mesorhizobium sp. M0047 TaxID=2956859 RepID=UPI00333B4403